MNERGNGGIAPSSGVAGLRIIQTGRVGGFPTAPRMAELVAAQLRRRIIDGDLEDGDELPREADLVGEFSVSRPSLREAIRILETEGLLRIRRGKIGGAVVQTPTPASAAYHLSLTLQSRATTVADLSAALEVLEPTCAGMVANLEADARKIAVARLSDLVQVNAQAIGEGDAFSAGALGFHEAIVALCGNTSIAILTSALESVLRSQESRWAVHRSQQGNYPDAAFQEEVQQDHDMVVDLIAVGDVAGATAAMRTHLHKSQPYLGDPDQRIDVL